MGEVYEADDRNLGHRVALKTVRMDRLSDVTSQERLRREAVLALQVSHPNVCRIIDFNWHRIEGGAQVAVLSMLFIEGRTLDEVLREKGTFTTAEALPIVRQIVAALDAAHAAGIVHRDLKPSNVMLTGDRVMVTDFGIAVAPSSDSALTQTGQMIGTPAYMAPEQLRSGEVTSRSDIYSLGVVIFEMLAGRRPGAGERDLEHVGNSQTETRSMLRAWNAAIHRALDPDPARRFESVRALEQALPDSRPAHPIARRTLIVSAASLAGVSALFLALRFTKWGHAVKPGSLCMLIPIQNATRDQRLSSYSVLLRSQLEQSRYIRPWDPARLPTVLRRMRRPETADSVLEPAIWREVALREGVPLLVMGSLSQLGDEYSLQMRIEKLGASPIAPAEHADRTFQASSAVGLGETSRDVANWIRSEAGELADSIAGDSRAPSAVTTSSWDALTLYQQAQDLGSRDSARALLLLREAIRIDPDFALAHMRAGDILVTARRWDGASFLAIRARRLEASASDPARGTPPSDPLLDGNR